jgi:membrane fusion protein, type I secretion system
VQRSGDQPGRALALPNSAVPPAQVSLEAQLEASIKSPPVGRTLRLALLALGLTLVPFFGWATMTTMERAVLATGTLIPEGRRKTVNLLEPGILRRLLVREGEVVDAGQPLLQLDVTQAEATADQARATFWSGRAKIARLRAEQAELRALSFPDELMRTAAGDPAIRVFLEAEQALFEARWKTFDGQASVQERQITQFQEQIAGARAQRAAAEAQLRSAREQLQGMRQLQSQGLVSLFRLQEMQRLEQTYIGTIGQFTAQEAQLREQVAGAQKQLETLRLTRLSEIATELQATEAAVATAVQQLRAAQDVLGRREVLSPEAGKVVNIQAFTPGGTIGSSQPIMDIVPVRDRFVVELQVMPVDIEQVTVGQRVNTRLTSYRVRTVPMISGRVIHVAADIMTNASTGLSYFLARAELDLDVLDRLPDVTLQAGMPAEVFVLGEERTPLSYLWSPLRNAARRAFRD